MNKDNFRYNKDLGGGSLNDAGAYGVFMSRKIFDREPISVTSNLFYDKENGVDMRGEALLDFGEGKSALLAFNFDAVYQNNDSVWGQKGVVSIARAYAIPPNVKPEIELITNENLKETKTQIDVPPANHFELASHDFCDTVLHKENRKEKILSIYEKILNQAKVLEAIRLSASENRKVQLSEIK